MSYRVVHTSLKELVVTAVIVRACSIVLLVLICRTPEATSAASLHTIAFPVPSQPPLVRFSGTIQSPNEMTADHQTLEIVSDAGQWQFTLDDVETLTYTTDPDWSILDDVVPRRLHFVGPDRLLHAIARAEDTGTPIRVRGRLYIASRMFLVTRVEHARRLG